MSWKLVKREDIQEEMVLITESNTDYITPSGKVYKDYKANSLMVSNDYRKHLFL